MRSYVSALLRALVPALVVLLAATPARAQIDPTPAEEPPPPPPPAPPPAPVPAPLPPPLQPLQPAPQYSPDLQLEPPPARRKAHFFGSFEAGYSYQSLYSIPINGASFCGILGSDLGALDVGGLVEVVPGLTQGGLQTTSIALGAEVQGHFDRVRLGGALRLGTFNANRVTDGGSLLSLSVGLSARLSVDVVQWGNDGGLFLVLKGSLDSVGASLYGASAGLGVRF